jgi:hypothetical protein
VDVNRILAGEQLEWARGAVAELEQFGAVSKWSDVRSEGTASSPRPQFLEARPFKLEQLPGFVKQLQRNDRLFVADITSAYHHVVIAKRPRTPLGFTFDGIDYVYTCLPFGLSASAYVFCEFSA